MWRSPIQICGTVRRPLFCIISARRAGSRSTRTLSIFTPFSKSRRSAAWQKGHAEVQYISTFGITAAPSFLHRQAGLLPAGEAAGKIQHAPEALALERARRLAGALAAVAIDDDRTVLAFQLLADTGRQPRERQI